MTISEYLILAQTIVLFITAIIVFYYTLETTRIRKETKLNNDLLSEQITLLRQAQSYAIEKDITQAEPLIIYRGSKYGTEKAITTFYNEGATVTDIKMQPIEKFSINIKPSSIIRKEHEGQIIFSGYPDPIPDELHFDIYYKNLLGKSRKKSFRFFPQNSKFEEIT